MNKYNYHYNQTQKIYNMELHDEITFDLYERWWIKRVPGGWLYIYCNEFSNSLAFVPYNEEFKQGE